MSKELLLYEETFPSDDFALDPLFISLSFLTVMSLQHLDAGPSLSLFSSF
jgi:hypothetical protein